MRKCDEIGVLIKKYIKFRNKRIKTVAAELGMKQKTLSEQLITGTLRAEQLFRIAACLDIDLNWMMAALGYLGPVGSFDGNDVPRMSDEFRKKELGELLPRLDELISINLGDTIQIRKQLLAENSNNLIYLLDVFVPSDKSIKYTQKMGKLHPFIVGDTPKTKSHTTMMAMHKTTQRKITAEQALDIIIEDRKDEIL